MGWHHAQSGIIGNLPARITAGNVEADLAAVLALVDLGVGAAGLAPRFGNCMRGLPIAEWAGHSVDVLLRVYAKCISGQHDEAKCRIGRSH